MALDFVIVYTFIHLCIHCLGHLSLLHDTGYGNNFSYITPKAQATRARIEKQGYVKLKNFCSAKEELNE
jgi:hypothetical protein